MNELDGATVVHGYPADRAVLDHLNSRVPPELKFVPSIEHTIMNCQLCGMSVWIGPKQAEIVGSPFERTAVLCTVCVVLRQRALDADIEVRAVNPHEADIPRRL